jgi:hypothetical protein
MTITEGIKTYRLPNPTCQEDLETRWITVLNYGDKVILAGYYYKGPGRPSYFGAVYEYHTDDTSSEGAIGLCEVSEAGFEDNGHAIEWALQNA